MSTSRSTPLTEYLLSQLDPMHNVVFVTNCSESFLKGSMLMALDAVVMGRADEKKKDHKPETITPMETENIGCDKGANARVDENDTLKPCKPLSGYKAML